jgi:peptidoglycan/xylan/chitin deacetylase (PgdA/CDA1 family)
VNDWPAAQRAVEAALAKQAGMRRPRRVWRHRFKKSFPPGVYVLAYHSIVDEDAAEPWELAYGNVRTSLERFREQVSVLVRSMQPVRLTDVPALLADGRPAEPSFVVTFDDGFANLAGAAADVLAAAGISPTVFVCGDYASRRSVSYRVPLAVLEREGQGTEAAAVLNDRLGRSDVRAGELLAATKNRYVAGDVEEAALAAWETCRPGESLPQAHLSYAQLRDLVHRGWTVGNHTLGHRTLAGLGPEELERQVIGNHEELSAEGLSPASWLAYPQGASRHVDPGVRNLLERHQELFAVFAGGGVNVAHTRTEWLRIPVLDESSADVVALLHNHAAATRDAAAAARDAAR